MDKNTPPAGELPAATEADSEVTRAYQSGTTNKKKLPSRKERISKASSAAADPHGGAIQQRGAARSAAVSVEAAVPFLEVPRDDEDWRFARSFRPAGEEALARAHLAEHGFVVFRDVLTSAEAAASRDEILSYIESVSEGFDAADESTWHNWRSQQFGMPPPNPSAFWKRQLEANRRHPNVSAAYAQLLGCAPGSLRCSHDRWALYPRGLRTRRNVHLDINPYQFVHGWEAVAARRAEYAYAGADELYGGHDNLVSAEHGPHLQGTIALLDNEEQDAGFLCVPGSHRHFETWVAALAPGACEGGPRYDFPDHSHFHSRAQRVPVRQGSLIVWDVRLVHGSAPDQSPQGPETRPRFVQFVTLRTAQLLQGEEQASRRADLVRRLYATHGLEEPTDPVQRAVAGLPAAKEGVAGEQGGASEEGVAGEQGEAGGEGKASEEEVEGGGTVDNGT